MIFRISILDRFGMDRLLNTELVDGQLLLHLLHDLLRLSTLSADVVVLLRVLLDVEQHVLGVLPRRLGFVGHAGRGVVPSV